MIDISVSLCSVVFRLNINIAKSVIRRLTAWCPYVSQFVCAFQAITVIVRDACRFPFLHRISFSIHSHSVFTDDKKTRGAHSVSQMTENFIGLIKVCQFKILVFYLKTKRSSYAKKITAS